MLQLMSRFRHKLKELNIRLFVIFTVPQMENMSNLGLNVPQAELLRLLNSAFNAQRSLITDEFPLDQVKRVAMINDMIDRIRQADTLEFAFVRDLCSKKTVIVLAENTSKIRKSAEHCLLFAHDHRQPTFALGNVKDPRPGQTPTRNGIVEQTFDPSLHLVIDTYTFNVLVEVYWNVSSGERTDAAQVEKIKSYHCKPDCTKYIKRQIAEELSGANLHFSSLVDKRRFVETILDRVRRFPSCITETQPNVTDYARLTDVRPFHQRSGTMSAVVTVFRLRTPQ